MYMCTVPFHPQLVQACRQQLLRDTRCSGTTNRVWAVCLSMRWLNTSPRTPVHELVKLQYRCLCTVHAVCPSLSLNFPLGTHPGCVRSRVLLWHSRSHQTPQEKSSVCIPVQVHHGCAKLRRRAVPATRAVTAHCNIPHSYSTNRSDQSTYRRIYA